ncbi:hypothetical protein CEXT_221961, partial [Caerostris extrusa]
MLNPLWTRYWLIVFPIGGFFAGKYLDDSETKRMSDFRDRSVMYGAN